jgi:hypothetical protein
VYLALGDSLGVSVQPNGDTRSGYAEQVFQLEQARTPTCVRQARLSGERTNDRPLPASVSLRGGLAARSAVAVLRAGRCVRRSTSAERPFQCFRFGRISSTRRASIAAAEDLGPLTSIVETCGR